MKLIITLLIILTPLLNAYSCKCVIPGDEIEDAYNKATTVFIGQCVKAELAVQEDSNNDTCYIVRYTFDIQHKWKGVSGKNTITVSTGIGFGDCGFQFNLGLSYIVYGYINDGYICTNICKRTRMVGFYPKHIDEEAQKEIDKIDLLLKR